MARENELGAAGCAECTKWLVQGFPRGARKSNCPPHLERRDGRGWMRDQRPVTYPTSTWSVVLVTKPD
ncbi:hypothetical protein GCM10022261_17250 [Brevibacterium daeguense]|uniref:Uncharacterized protein n=1 Tax=Brevibacterium daeguense TaxID=909936 RepID=A0ABP8EJP8_9MICO